MKLERLSTAVRSFTGIDKCEQHNLTSVNVAMRAAPDAVDARSAGESLPGVQWLLALESAQTAQYEYEHKTLLRILIVSRTWPLNRDIVFASVLSLP